MKQTDIRDLLKDRILILDGAMGTMIQQHRFTEEDFRGERFAKHTCDLKGNNDLLCLTQPAIIESLHHRYLDSGADIITTNTFNSNRISLSDYDMEDLAYEINKAAAIIAKRAASDCTHRNPQRPRYVAGDIGPTNKTLRCV